MLSLLIVMALATISAKFLMGRHIKKFDKQNFDASMDFAHTYMVTIHYSKVLVKLKGKLQRIANHLLKLPPLSFYNIWYMVTF